ncbi:MAG: carbohydrate ABC transporter substrate-binding protein [Butyrivibrio sp.]|nr:carbohydrate ABC transporter substrate-binding protein [Butyrivibrio sp.]
MQQVISMPSEEEPRKVIRIAAWYEDSYITNISAFLANEFPEYDFEYVYIQRANYESVIDSQISNVATADIICVTENMAERYARGKYLVPLNSMVGAFSTDALDRFKFLNKYYAVPSVSTYECFYVNLDYFDEFGFEPPSIYSDFTDMCMTAMEHGVKPLSAGLKDKEGLANSAMTVMQSSYFQTPKGRSFGARLEYGRASFYEELYPYMQLWYQFIEKGIFTPDMCLMDKKAAIEEFASGKTVFLSGGPEDYNQILKANPEMRLTAIAFGGKDDGTQLITGGCEYGFAVVNNDVNVKEALEVVRSLSTLMGQRAIWKDSPGSKTYLNNVFFEPPKEFDNLQDVLENNLYTLYRGWGYYSREISLALENELQQVLLGREALDTALIKLDSKAKSIVEGN